MGLSFVCQGMQEQKPGMEQNIINFIYVECEVPGGCCRCRFASQKWDLYHLSYLVSIQIAFLPQFGPLEWCFTWHLMTPPHDFLKPVVTGSILLCLTRDSWFSEPPSEARMGIMGKWWLEEPSGTQNDYFAPSQHGAEHTSCAGPIHVPCLQVCWLNHMLIDLQGLCSVIALTQLCKQVLLLLSVSWWPHPIILNPLSVIIGFRNVPQTQPR